MTWIGQFHLDYWKHPEQCCTFSITVIVGTLTRHVLPQKPLQSINLTTFTARLLGHGFLFSDSSHYNPDNVSLPSHSANRGESLPRAAAILPSCRTATWKRTTVRCVQMFHKSKDFSYLRKCPSLIPKVRISLCVSGLLLIFYGRYAIRGYFKFVFLIFCNW